MSEVLKILEGLFQGVANSVTILEINPPGTMVFGTLVRHIDDPKIFGSITESYKTDKKDIDGNDIFYYNIVWEGIKDNSNDYGAGNYQMPFEQKYKSVEPEYDLISWHGNILNNGKQ
jgi:hypothetical protein